MATSYVDYEYYVDDFGGDAMAAADFNKLALQASMVIDQITFERAYAVIDADTDTELIEKIKNATCAIAEEIQEQKTNGIKNVASETVGSHSVSYVVNKDTRITSDQKIQKVAKLYLGSSGLMFGGFYEDE